MKFTEALRILQNKPHVPGFTVVLACGFTPLHLRTFLEAHLQAVLPNRRVGISTGLYGDLAGTVEGAGQSAAQAVAAAIEWPDLDPRLGYRTTGGWSPADLTDIVATVERSLDRLQRAFQTLPDSVRIVVSLPTLAMPPVFYTPAWQSGEAEWRLLELIAAAGRRIAALPHAAVLSPRRLEELSPRASRPDLRSELSAGLPYTLAHADILGSALAELIHPPAPKKGLITDLDDTLWSGIVGDAGAANVAWDLAGHAQIHGLYQRVLSALADQGTLVAVASKNSPEIVESALERADILLPRHKIFPAEIHWGAKSASVGRILKTWNIAADSVVFVDDSPMELAEVELAHPGIRCLLFPKGDYSAATPFLRDLRAAFGKPRVTEEDALRRESIRQGAEFRRLADTGQEASPEAFLAGLKARITIDFRDASRDPRVLELVNKTNQFNLNGVRYGEADWHAELERPGAFVASVAYEDRFGPLGKIVVISGRVEDGILRIGTWVMSCRAFARRIEYQCVRQLFERYGARAIRFDFAATPRNGPARDFFVSLGAEPAGPLCLERQSFEDRCPALHHAVSYVE